MLTIPYIANGISWTLMLLKPPIPDVKRKTLTNICKSPFRNKAVELVKVPRIVREGMLTN